MLEIDAFVLISCNTQVRNGEARLVVLNRIARSVVDAQRRRHRTHVFTYKGAAQLSDINLFLEEGRDNGQTRRWYGFTISGTPLVGVCELLG